MTPMIIDEKPLGSLRERTFSHKTSCSSDCNSVSSWLIIESLLNMQTPPFI